MPTVASFHIERLLQRRGVGSVHQHSFLSVQRGEGADAEEHGSPAGSLRVPGHR